MLQLNFLSLFLSEHVTLVEGRLTAEVTENPPEYFISSAPYGLVYKDKPLCVKGTELRQEEEGQTTVCPALLSDQNTEHVVYGRGKRNLCTIRIPLDVEPCF